MSADAPIRPRLGLWDAVSIIVGIVVGTAIFKLPSSIFQNVTTPWQAFGLWIAGGALALVGALCYAELATTYRRSGGDYEYLGRAYGSWMGFLFGWAQLTIVRTGNIGAMSYAFADYGVRLWDLDPGATAWLAATPIVALTGLNMLGIVVGRNAQNVLSVVKVIGLLAVVVAGVAWGGTSSLADATLPLEGPGMGIALVFILYAYGGWNDAAYVAAEVRDGARNIPRALILGVVGITVIYLLVNAAFLLVLGFEGARASGTPASDVLEHAVGPWGAKAISVLVMISALGAINGMILTGSRVNASLGRDHRLFRRLGRWDEGRGAPLGALVAQAGITVLLVLAIGTVRGRSAIDAVFDVIRLPRIPWDDYFGGFETLVAATSPVFWTFFILTGISVFVLRARNPQRPRPFSIPWYPLPPLIFCAMCGYMLYSSLAYAGTLVGLAVVAIAAGVPLFLLGRR